MLTPTVYERMPDPERKRRLEAGAGRLGPVDSCAAVRLSVNLGVSERTVYDWFQTPRRIPFMALALLDAWARER